MGRRGKHGRDVNGILLLDKPRGLTSNAALQRVKRLYRAAKAGHTGNLDPLATGVLPVCLGEATKISAYLLDADKAYRVECTLGVTTDTGDSEGEVVQTRPVSTPSASAVRHVLEQYTGEIEQMPPMYSAVKHQGQPLYKLAREGRTVERRSRRIRIDALELLAIDGDRVELDVRCSKGTYVRTLVEDIGEALGCGAHVSALRRTRAAPFDDSDLVDAGHLEALVADERSAELDALLLPVDAALSDWPRVSLPPPMAGYIEQGQAVQVPRAPAEGMLRLYRREPDTERFIGVGRVLDDGRVGPKRLIFAG
jgi:tRNA pseudouridine55 synthase